VADPRAEYKRRIALWRAAHAAGERTYVRISNLRLATAAAAVLIAWLAFVRNAASPAWLAACLIAFLGLVVWHARVIQRNERAARARRLYERGLDRIEGRWAGSGPDGRRFLSEHPYARDLDVFGEGSLFQLIDTARTEAGEETLADWLRAPAGIEEIRSRQTAVAELKPRVAFREDLAVLAAEAHVGRTGVLVAWASAEPAGLPAAAAPLLAASAALTVALIAAGVAGWSSAGWAAGWLVVQMTLALYWRSQVHQVVERIANPAYDLGLLVELLARIESEPMSSPRLAQVHARLVRDGAPPSHLIARLRSFVAALDTTENLLFKPVAPFLLVKSQAAVAIDRWHAEHRMALLAWLESVGELEALSSLATHAYEHDEDPFPELMAPGPRLIAEGLGHPLLTEAAAVRNDIALGGDDAHVLVVSGSNMSGKSTLLRAVGVNVVLALAGGVVRARRLALSPLAIGATLRIEDSLQAGHSRFFAEILRIRQIVETTRGPLPLLFLLDEILHGTNSHDRRIGAQAIVRALVAAGAIGLVTTHDLALTGLVSALGSRAANVHFEDRLEDGKMVFDYRMRPGVVEHSNALDLMRSIGLEV
jgi:hypothetical protein